MWLITAVGAVHGQSKFTFALEQKRIYEVGRDKAADIRFDSKHVRPREGKLVVGDWDPTQRRRPPELRWKVEPKKTGGNLPFKTLTIISDADMGSTHREDYAMHEEVAGQGCFLEENGAQGIELAADAWFIAQWQDLQIQYDKLKDEEEEVRDTLRRYCISYTLAFNLNDLPDYVLAPSFKSNPDCNYAVCYGIRILLPTYLEALLGRLVSCWKKVADHQDSWSLPDKNAPEFQPELDATLPNARKDFGCWLPAPMRSELFKGWHIMGLRGKNPPAERRYLIAMGAQYTDIDVLTRPLLSGKDLQDRVSKWLEELDASIGRERGLLVYFAGVKDNLIKQGVNWNSVVSATSQQLGVILASGSVCWGAVRFGSVQGFIEGVSSNGPPPAPGPSEQPTFAVPEIPQAPVAEPGPKQSATRPSQPCAIPSTFPDETEGEPSRKGKAIEAPVKSNSSERLKAVQDSASEITSTHPIRKPLRRRAGKRAQPSFDILGIMDSEPPQEDFVPDSQQRELSMEPPATQAMKTYSVPSTQAQTQTQTHRSGLKRRAGGHTQPGLLFSTVFDHELTPIKNEETPAEIRELYEQTKREARVGIPSPLPSKRARLVSAESGSSYLASRESLIGPQAGSAAPKQGMDVDEVEEDFVQRTLRRAAKAKREGKAQGTQTMGPSPVKSNVSATRPRYPSEEAEEVEEAVGRNTKRKGTLASPTKKSSQATKKSTQKKDHPEDEVTRDEAFLQAISKASKSKNAIDELDREFNQLRIPKPGANGGSTVVKANVWDANHPDYTIVNDFDDGMRGNFIQIVRKDLFRKDGGRKEVGAAEEMAGKPNFKKFSKKQVVKRDPVPLVLVGRTLEDAEMGEPYWPSGTQKAGRKMQTSQALDGADEDSLPVLPRSKRRLLDQRDANTADHEDMPPLTANRRGKASIPNTLFQSQCQRTKPVLTGRKTRVASVVSDVSSVDGAGASTSARGGMRRGTQQARALLEDSEEEGVEFTPSALGTGRGSRSTNGTQEGTGSAVRSSDRTAINARGGVPASGSVSATFGRRKLLLVDDDDDGMVFKGLAKKRRLG